MNFVKRDGVRVAVKRELRFGEVLKRALDVSSIGKGYLDDGGGARLYRRVLRLQGGDE